MPCAHAYFVLISVKHYSISLVAKTVKTICELQIKAFLGIVQRFLYLVNFNVELFVRLCILFGGLFHVCD